MRPSCPYHCGLLRPYHRGERRERPLPTTLTYTSPSGPHRSPPQGPCGGGPVLALRACGDAVGKFLSDRGVRRQAGCDVGVGVVANAYVVTAAIKRAVLNAVTAQHPAPGVHFTGAAGDAVLSSPRPTSLILCASGAAARPGGTPLDMRGCGTPPRSPCWDEPGRLRAPLWPRPPVGECTEGSWHHHTALSI